MTIAQKGGFYKRKNVFYSVKSSPFYSTQIASVEFNNTCGVCINTVFDKSVERVYFKEKSGSTCEMLQKLDSPAVCLMCTSFASVQPAKGAKKSIKSSPS